MKRAASCAYGDFKHMMNARPVNAGQVCQHIAYRGSYTSEKSGRLFIMCPLEWFFTLLKFKGKLHYFPYTAM